MIPIFGDPMLGYSSMSDEHEHDDPAETGRYDYLLTWPLPYWERYDALKLRAQEAADTKHLYLVICQSGDYYVYGNDVLKDGRRQRVAGPWCRDRHRAWEAFVEGLSAFEGPPTTRAIGLSGKAKPTAAMRQLLRSST